MTGAGAGSHVCVCVSGIVIFECGASKKAGQILNNKHYDDTPNLLIQEATMPAEPTPNGVVIP